MTNEELSHLKQAIDNLKGLFKFENRILVYKKSTQGQSNFYLKRACELIGLFKNNSDTEAKNIDNEIFFVDEKQNKTGKIVPRKVVLVSIDEMRERVSKVLDTNNLHSCLKSMAVCNKCAHGLETEVKSRSNAINDYYKKHNPNHISSKISFRKPFKDLFPNIDVCNLYHIKTTDNFKKIRSDINKAKDNINSISINKKIEILKYLNINTNISENEINNILINIDIEKLDYSYIFRAYEEGKQLVELVDRMFTIKDYYISMVGQELKMHLKHIKYKIQQTEEGSNGFKYMLTIDDEELSYPIEVHIPNYLHDFFVKDLKLKDSGTKTEPHVRDKAVYTRKREEVKAIKKALNEGKVPALNTPPETRTRAEMISRGYEEGEEVSEIESVESEAKKADDYRFVTFKIDSSYNLFEEFLLSIGGYEQYIDKSKEILHNENYPIEYSYGILCEKYFKLFHSLDNDYKKEFISYAFKNIMNGDEFDKKMYSNKILNDYYDDRFIDSFGKIFIYKDLYKHNYYKNINKYSIEDYIKGIAIMEFDKNYENEDDYYDGKGLGK